MVSGAIGGFLDVASNFNTQAFLEDNLIGKFIYYLNRFTGCRSNIVGLPCFTSLCLCYPQLNFAGLAGK